MTSGDGRPLRIATRRSALALAQAEAVAGALGELGHAWMIVPMSTRGDAGAPGPLGTGGVKGLFVDEIVRALASGDVDVAVHSAKDLPASDPDGIVVAAIPPRAPAHDVLVTRLPALPPGGCVGTSSLRRRAQLMASRPDVEVVELRGNVDSRLRRLEAGDVDGVILAAAGLSRLGLSPRHAEALDVADMVPAPAQGFLAIQTRATGDAFAAAALLDDSASRRSWEAERHLVRALGADCALPVGAFARPGGASLVLDAVVLSADGARRVDAHARGADPRTVAQAAAETLFAGGAGTLLAPFTTRRAG
ncbi:MAG TPA: hydroxymethylbilane synthase [Actinomycetota bacterium]|nr:hydroxymethylbilane synthase [Actinomycetota bacterium]